MYGEYLRNCWYVIAWDYEIPAEGLFARTVLNQPIVVFRTGGGYAALEDRCCHRHAPLSRGRKEGEAVRCGYHGLKFDASGKCVDAPGMDRIPPQAKVKTYPVAARNKWIFVWMGDPAGAEERLLPDNFSNDHPQWRNKPGYMHYDTPYLLICDNLLDFSHLSYVHEKTLGGSHAIAQARPAIEALERGVRVSRHVPDVPPPPYYRKIRAFDGRVDRWFVYDFLFPGTLLMSSGGKPAGQKEPDAENSVMLHSCQTLTPESDATTHYFFQQSHRADAGDASVTEGIYQSLVTAFNEDRDMISA
ncbi:MAG TPA: aromatic ring-hydroxylating dioxygenase subunit alpha [Burkholderiales bacterium]|nr:aromatic ring-hydroxylating dioxygenase subunit alpha [Burkholderiales bacterium]